jgi:hypothetical protein
VQGSTLPRNGGAVQIALTLALHRLLTIFPHKSMTIANQKKKKRAPQILVLEKSRKKHSLVHERAKGGNKSR